jgi:hypothetical protein
MKNLIAILLISFLMTHCSKKATQLTLKDYQTVEGIKIGMPLNTAWTQLNKNFFVEKTKTEVLDDPTDTYEYVVFTNKSKKETLFSYNGGYEKQNKDKVFRIVIRNPKYTTAEGIHVGMNVRDLKTKTRLKSADFNFQDGLFLLSGKFDGGYWIDIDAKKDYKEFNYTNPFLNAIPGDLKIKAIVFF